MQSRTCAFSVVAAIAFAGPVLAAETPSSAQTQRLIMQGIAAYDAMEYDNALPLLEQTARRPDINPRDRMIVLKHQAFILILQGKDILARDAVISIYDTDQSFELPATVSPKFRRFFADVRKDWQPKPKERVIVAKPAATGSSPPGQTLTGVAQKKPNFFVRFWPSWTCLAAGIGLLVPGTIIGLDATSGSETLKNAPKDETGRMKTMTLKEAQAMQDEADSKGLTADILLGAGAAAMVAGAVMFFVYDGADRVSATKSTSISFQVDGSTRLLMAAWAF